MWQYVLIDRGNESGKSLLVWVKYTGAWGKITPMKILPNISAYVSLKDFTPDLFFYTDISAISVNFVTLCAVSHYWFGLNVQVPGVKLPK